MKIHHHIYAVTLSLFLLLASSICGVAAKNETFIMFGFIYEQNDSTGYESVDSVEVSLTRSDTIAVPFKLLSKAGESGLSTDELKLLVEGPRDIYQVRLYKKGYEPLLREAGFNAASSGMVYVDNLLMKPERQVTLDGIEVKATAIKMVMKGDTIVYNADAFDLGEGSMLESLVAMFPGAELTSDGQIKVNGRVLSELLINGKDFFAGDPNVALKNLPAYTVDKVKVYDKAADDAYLTKSNVKLSRKEDEENLVMDVVLKKEYSTGLMLNLEAGYGLNDRYSGRVFGLAFTDKLRISGFGNFNNVNDSGSASTDGYWRDSYYGSGTSDLQMGGLDMLYAHGKWEANASLKASRDDTRTLSESAIVNYYDTGDIYGRSDNSEKTLLKQFSFDGEAEYKGNAVYLSVSPNVSYSSSRGSTVSRRANFTHQPEGHSRTEALDSLFSPDDSGMPSRYERWLLNRNGTVGLNRPRNFIAGGDISATIRPENMTGSLHAGIEGQYTRDDSESRTVYDQKLGPESPEGTVPVKRDSYRSSPRRSKSLSGYVRYRYDKNSFTETRKRTWQLSASAQYDYSNRHNDSDYWIATGDDADTYFSQNVVLPSLTRPENARIDDVNTFSTRYESNDLTGVVEVAWKNSRIVEVDSGINPSFGFNVYVRDIYRQHYGRRISAAADNSYTQRVNSLLPGAGLNFSSANKKRYIGCSLYYSIFTSTPDVFSFIPSTTNADPFNVVERGAEALRDSRTHSVNAHLGFYGRTGHNFGVSASASWSYTENAMGVAKRYDPATGISYTRSVNVDGNQTANAYCYFWFNFGKDNKLSFSNMADAKYYRNSDYVTATSGQPVLQRVNSFSAYEKISLSWDFGKGSTVGLNGQCGWNAARSPRRDFNEVNVWNYGGEVFGTIVLPLEFKVRTSLVFKADRGYESQDMNRNIWMWDASLSKDILKGDMTFKLSAVDILNQKSNTTVTVNAQGSYEQWTNTTPRYAMLSVIYRFRHSPKKMDISIDDSF